MGTALRTTPLHKKFGIRLKELRNARDMTQEDLADAIGVDRSYMGFIERGEKNITLDKILKLSDALKIQVKELFDF